MPCMQIPHPCSECWERIVKEIYHLEAKIESLKKELRPDTNGVLGGHDRMLFLLDSRGIHNGVFPEDKDYIKGHSMNTKNCTCKDSNGD